MDELRIKPAAERVREFQRRERTGLELFQLEARPEEVRSFLVQEGIISKDQILDKEDLANKLTFAIFHNLKSSAA